MCSGIEHTKFILSGLLFFSLNRPTGPIKILSYHVCLLFFVCRFLLFSTTFYSIQLFSVVFNRFQPSSAFSAMFNCFSHFQPFTTILTVFNHFLTFSAVFSSFQLFQLFSAIFNHFQPFSAVSIRFQLFSTIFNQAQPFTAVLVIFNRRNSFQPFLNVFLTIVFNCFASVLLFAQAKIFIVSRMC